MQESRGDLSLHLVLSRLLLAGVLISVSLMLLAIALGLVNGQGLPSHLPPLDLTLAGVSRLEAEGILGLSVLALLVTPIAGVIVAIVGFAHQRDWFYAAASLMVLAILTISATLVR